MSDVSPEMQKAALDFLAEENREARTRSEAVHELLEDTTPKPVTPPATSPPPSDAHVMTSEDLRDVASLVWTGLDIAVVKLAGRHYKLQPDELARLLPPTEKVLKKYLPPDLKVSPEYILLGVALAVYTPKLLSAPSDAEFEQPKATEAAPS